MKRFIIYTTIFIVINLLLIYMQDAYTYYTGAYQDNVAGAEIYKAKQAARQKRKVKKLLIGDSVCKQMYDVGAVEDSVWSLACNQAVTMAGHYCLLHDFVTTNSDSLPEEIILSFDAGSLANNLDRFAFQYFLKPFWMDDYQRLLANPHLQERKKQIPYNWAANLPIIRCNSWTPDYTLPQGEYALISPVTSDYVDSICAFADSLGIKVHLFCNPIRESRRQNLKESYQNAQDSGETQKHSDLWQEWYQSAQYVSDALFHDYIHFNKQNIPNDPYSLK